MMLSKEDLEQILKEISLDEEKQRVLYEALVECVCHNPHPVQSNANLLTDALTDNNTGEMLVALGGIGLQALLIYAKLIPDPKAEDEPTVDGRFYRKRDGEVVFRSRCFINPKTLEVTFAPYDAEHFPAKKSFDRECVQFMPFLSAEYPTVPASELNGHRTMYWYKDPKETEEKDNERNVG